jgi:hypothetical protein
VKRWVLISLAVGSVAVIVVPLVAMYVAHRPPEGGRNLLTIEDTPVRVEEFQVRDATGRPLWEIRSSPGTDVSTIHYGDVPPGFTQTIPLAGRPRAFRKDESLITFTLTDDWQYEHRGVALGPASFLGGGYTNGPRQAAPRTETPAPDTRVQRTVGGPE